MAFPSHRVLQTILIGLGTLVWKIKRVEFQNPQSSNFLIDFTEKKTIRPLAWFFPSNGFDVLEICKRPTR
jgi:hypothetical protein